MVCCKVSVRGGLLGLRVAEIPNLTGANLVGARMLGLDLVGANLSGADLYTAEDLTQEQIDETSGHADANLPEGLERPRDWLLEGERES